jgi:hypothetical protein
MVGPPAHPDLQPEDERTALVQRLDQYRVIAVAALDDVSWDQASAPVLAATDMDTDRGRVRRSFVATADLRSRGGAFPADLER